MLKIRVYFVVCSVLGLLAGGVVASARGPRHPRHDRPVTALPSMGPQPIPSIFGIDLGVSDTSHANAHYGLLQYHFVPKPAAIAFGSLARSHPGR